MRYLGVSNLRSGNSSRPLPSSAQRVGAAWVIQPRFNAVDHVPFTVDLGERPLPDLLDACPDQNVAVCAYAALAG